MTDHRPTQNRRILLAQRPHGAIGTDCFGSDSQPVPEPSEGEALVEVEWLSIDPTIRGWMEYDTYLPAIPLGDVIRSGGAGEVVASRNDRYPVGSRVFAMTGWQRYSLVGPETEALTIPDGIDYEDALSVYGVTGLTAYFGMVDIAKPQPGETVVVSGAAGGVGSVAGQIGRILGCHVVGIAGSEEKCRWVVDELGFEACVDYKSENVAQRLRELCPDGIDVYFDNVGGEILDIALGQINIGARIPLCGAISTYNDDVPQPGPANLRNAISQRARLEGFIVLDYMDRALEAILTLAQWREDGELVSRVDVVEGLDRAPAALDRLFTGANIGKVLVRLAP